MGMLTPWSEDEIARLRVHHAAGLTYSEIATALVREGFPLRTRNAVLGRANRMKLASRASADVHREIVKRRERKAMAQPATVEKIKAARAGTLNQRMLAKVARSVATLVSAPVESTVKGWPKPMTATAVHILSDDLRMRHCRMPLWDDATPVSSRFYCGAEVRPGTSWCPACMKLVYAPAQDRRAA
jgi:hypothetical protein